MARIFLSSSLAGTPSEQLQGALETIFQQLEDQINAGTAIISLNEGNQKLPEGMANGDVIFNLTGGELRAGVFNGVQVVYASFGSFTGAITDTQHGNRAGGTLHPVATVTVAGFMSAADKVKTDHYKGDTSSAAPASITEYPTNGDWGFHTDTVGVTYSLAKNKGGTIFKVLLT